MKKENFKKNFTEPGIIQKEVKGKLFKRKNCFNLPPFSGNYFFSLVLSKKENNVSIMGPILTIPPDNISVEYVSRAMLIKNSRIAVR